MRFFKELFKSKARKEADRLNEQWHTLINTAVRQLESSNGNHDQTRQFLSLLSVRDVRNLIPILKILVDEKLSDGSPILSKFFLRPVAESSIKCRIDIHDSSFIDPIKEYGFGIVRLGGSYIYEKDVVLQAYNGLLTMSFCDSFDADRIVEKCNQYYDALLSVRDGIISCEEICVPKYTKIEWNGGAFTFETELTPSRVDEIIASLPSECKYLREYREFLINKLAEASIRENPAVGRLLKTIDYKQPLVYCLIYSDFEKQHLRDLDYQAKNKEFESIINEIKDAAQKKIETES